MFLDWGLIVQKVGAICHDSGGDLTGAICPWGEMSDIRAASPLGLTCRVSFARSLIFRRKSAQINRSRGNLGNKSYQFATMATQTQLMCV